MYKQIRVQWTIDRTQSTYIMSENQQSYNENKQNILHIIIHNIMHGYRNGDACSLYRNTLAIPNII